MTRSQRSRANLLDAINGEGIYAPEHFWKTLPGWSWETPSRGAWGRTITDRRSIEELCKAAAGAAARKREVLLAAWEAVGRNTRRLETAQWEGLTAELHKAASEIESVWITTDAAAGSGAGARFEYRRRGERLHETWSPAVAKAVAPGRALFYGAYRPFILLTTSQMVSRLTRCKRGGCGRYFLLGPNEKGRRGSTVYCASRCGHLRWATESKKAARLRKWQEKRGRVDAAVRQAAGLKRQPRDLKAWIARKADVTKKFLTRHDLA